MKANYEFDMVFTPDHVDSAYRKYLTGYYAGRAMQGLLALPHDGGVEPHTVSTEELAKIAVDQAEALVAELVKRGYA
ncbi:MAG TPA: hypothetical protein VJL58_10240 [Pyrinomonadaceae bacterium]|nr:hypothetical protein [Pyrinomonadaceae bacterium]